MSERYSLRRVRGYEEAIEEYTSVIELEPKNTLSVELLKQTSFHREE